MRLVSLEKCGRPAAALGLLGVGRRRRCRRRWWGCVYYHHPILKGIAVTDLNRSPKAFKIKGAEVIALNSHTPFPVRQYFVTSRS